MSLSVDGIENTKCVFNKSAALMTDDFTHGQKLSFDLVGNLKLNQSVLNVCITYTVDESKLFLFDAALLNDSPASKQTQVKPGSKPKMIIL